MTDAEVTQLDLLGGPGVPLSAFDRDAAGRDKAAGQALALASDRALPWRIHAEHALLDLAAEGLPFTADDLVARIGLPDADSGQNQNNAVGALVSGAARRGIIERIGYRKSERTTSHARVVAIWKGRTA